MAKRKKANPGFIGILMVLALIVGACHKNNDVSRELPAETTVKETTQVITEPETTQSPETMQTEVEEEYVLNTSSRKFHRPDCASVGSMKKENRQDYTGTREAIVQKGYTPCGQCKP